MKQKYFLKIAFCFLLISTISYGQLVTTIDFESVDTGYTPSATEGSTFIDVFIFYSRPFFNYNFKI